MRASVLVNALIPAYPALVVLAHHFDDVLADALGIERSADRGETLRVGAMSGLLRILITRSPSNSPLADLLHFESDLPDEWSCGGTWTPRGS